MKYLFVLLALVALPACGQNIYPVGDSESPSLASGKKPCDPAQDKEPQNEWFSHGVDADGFADPKQIKVYRCDTTPKWMFDRALTDKDIADSTKSITASKAKIARRKMLAIVIISRVVTDQELAEVIKLGTDIFADPFDVCGGFSECGYSGDYRTMEEAHELYLSRKFNDLLAQQFKLRAIASEHARPVKQQSYLCSSAVGCSNDPAPESCAEFYKSNPGSLVNCVDKPQEAPGYYCGTHDCKLPAPTGPLNDMLPPLTPSPQNITPWAVQTNCRPLDDGHTSCNPSRSWPFNIAPGMTPFEPHDNMPSPPPTPMCMDADGKYHQGNECVVQP